jgi:chromosome partitioning protein
MKVIAFMNNKGGVGKTTSVQNVGYQFAQKGHKTLLIDLDPQSNLSQAFGLEDKDVTIYECLSDENMGTPLTKAVTVINENLHVVPSVLQLSTSEVDLINRFSRENILKRLIEEVAADYEFVFLDCPPSMGILTINALTASNFVFVPLQAEFFSFKGIDALNLFIHKIKKQINPKLQLLGVFMTMYKKQQNLSHSVRQTVREFFGEQLLDSIVRVNISLSEAQSQAKPIFEYAPQSNGAEDYKALADEIFNRLSKS